MPDKPILPVRVLPSAEVSGRRKACLLGRVTATCRTAAAGAAALGAVVGGIVATGYGVRAPMLVGAPILAVAGILGILMFSRATHRTESD